MLQAEQILQERYQLKQQLGNNPSRQTWLALDLAAEPKQLVIVKLLPFSPQTQWDDLKLFEREAQVLKHLNHTRIPQYRDYFSVEKEAGGGLPWFGLVQDYINGSSLQQLLKRGKHFTEAEAEEIATQLLNILIYLHELSPPVLHRDIKPSNIIWTEDEQVYLVDFGAVQERAKAEGVTFTVVGTGGYAPPEQLWGRAVPASDLYALGATLIHLLTGTSPAKLPQHRMRLQFQDKVTLSASFAHWIEKLTDPAPERRFSQARQALCALQAADRGSEETARKARYGRIGSLALLQYLAVFVCLIALPTFAVYRYIHEGKINITVMNRAQQAHFLEKMEFSNSLQNLDVGIKNPSKNYDYSIHATPIAVFNYATPRNKNLKGFVGAVFLTFTDGVTEAVFTRDLVCEANSPSINRPAAPVVQGNVIECAPGTKPLNSQERIVIGTDTALVYSSLNYVASGQYEKAITATQTITNGYFKVNALVAIAHELTTAGKAEQAAQLLSQAVKLTETIKPEYGKAQALLAIAGELAADPQYDQALKPAKSRKNDSDKAKTLTAIANELADAGKVEQAALLLSQALKVAQTLKPAYDKERLLVSIVNKLAAVGQYDQALKVAETIPDNSHKHKQEALKVIAHSRKLHRVNDDALGIQK
jgi:serine/threonine protein kinase